METKFQSNLNGQMQLTSGTVVYLTWPKSFPIIWPHEWRKRTRRKNGRPNSTRNSAVFEDFWNFFRKFFEKKNETLVLIKIENFKKGPIRCNRSLQRDEKAGAGLIIGKTQNRKCKRTTWAFEENWFKLGGSWFFGRFDCVEGSKWKFKSMPYV